ncbi:MAG: hypothetical protein WBN04_01540 [Paracoccaceae bacterium]
MSDRFADLKKIPKEPAARILARVHVKLATPVAAPVSAPVEVVLAELAGKAAWIDVLKLLAIALPAREAVWWACIAARDVVGNGEKNTTPCLKASEAWVFEPTEANREAARVSLDNVYIDDDTELCATATMYAPGNMGPGDLADYPAPAGAVSSCAFGMNMVSLSAAPDFDAHLQLLIDRALDIARGGNGQIDPAEAAKETGEA